LRPKNGVQSKWQWGVAAGHPKALNGREPDITGALRQRYAVRQETPNITPLIHRPVSIATDRPNAHPRPYHYADSRSIIPSRSRARAPSADRVLLDRSWVSPEEAVRR